MAEQDVRDKMARKRKLATLSRDDIGKRVAFTCTCCGHHVEGTLRAFTHGVFSHPSAGEVDVPRVGIMVYAYRNTHVHHWALPETLAMLTEQEARRG